MNIAHWLERSAKLHPTQPAIAEGMVLWSDYANFANQAARTASWLQSQGVTAGDRVVLFMHNRPEYLPLMWGGWWCGAVVVPINAKLHEREVAWIVAHSGAKLVFCDFEHRSQLHEHLNTSATIAQGDTQISSIAVHSDLFFLHDQTIPLANIASRTEDDAAWLFYTSGTTGRPKGVTLAARQLRWMSLSFLASIQSVTPGDAMLHCAPLSHGGGMYHLPYVLNGGMNVVPTSRGFDAAECLSLAAHWQRASLFAAPTMVRRLVEIAQLQATPPTGLATIVYGGGPMYLADVDTALQTLGPHLAQIYGQGECPMSISVLPRHVINDTAQHNYRARLGSVGYAHPMVEISIRDASGHALPCGQSGEVCVRGEVVMQGYWNDPTATQAAIQNGWLHTGDVGQIDEDGFLSLLDRSKDLIISGGSNIYPREVEEVILTHFAVSEVAVIGRADPEWGEIVVAYVVLRQSIEATQLDTHCLECIARFKRPKAYCFVDELPKNNYGKVLKTVLREWDDKRA